MSLSAADLAAKQAARVAWEQDRARLMLRQPFLALLAMQLELVPVVDARLATACTDGERVFVDAHFLLSLTDSARLFVLAHEVWHCAALHFARRGDRDQRLWNLACDHEVNALLESQGLPLPDGAVLYPALRGANAEAVYHWLQDNPAQVSERPDWADQHEVLVDDGGPYDPDLQLGPGNWRDWPARVVGAAQQVEQRHGRLPGEIEQWIDRLRRPVLPWRELLARFVADTVQRCRQWTPPNRRYLSQHLYLPGWRREIELRIALAVDTSGSTQPYLADFLAELAGIAGSFGAWQLRLLMCDTRLQSDQWLDSSASPDLSRLVFRGGGGTDLQPVFAHLQGEPPAALVFLTDGYGPAPAVPPDYPVLWVLTPDGTAPVAWGDVIMLPAAGGARAGRSVW